MLSSEPRAEWVMTQGIGSEGLRNFIVGIGYLRQVHTSSLSYPTPRVDLRRERIRNIRTDFSIQIVTRKHSLCFQQ